MLNGENEEKDLEAESFETFENLPKEKLVELVKEYYKYAQDMTNEMNKLRFIAYCDALTTYTINNSLNFEECRKKIFNRTYWETEYKKQHLSDELDFYLIDLNDLKKMNDNYGHLAGDKMICDCARLLSKFGTTFRLGGDEFAMVTYNKESTKMFNRYLATAVDLNFAYGFYHKKASDSFDHVIKMADDNMYNTKAMMKSGDVRDTRNASNLRNYDFTKQPNME